MRSSARRATTCRLGACSWTSTTSRRSTTPRPRGRRPLLARWASGSRDCCVRPTPRRAWRGRVRGPARGRRRRRRRGRGRSRDPRRRSRAVPPGGKEVFVRASIGIASADDGDARPEGAEELLRNADVAMYMAKEAGKGRYQVFEPAMHDTALQRLELKADLQRAVDNDEFVLHYQPVIELATGASRARGARRGSTRSAGSSRRWTSSRWPRRPGSSSRSALGAARGVHAGAEAAGAYVRPAAPHGGQPVRPSAAASGASSGDRGDRADDRLRPEAWSSRSPSP
jgi:hypothetical protein